MTGELVLLTGGTGFLGYAILVDLLKSGYRVRVTARSQAKVDKVRAAPSIAALNPPTTQLAFVIVPDMAVAGAYDDAGLGVDFIVHVAAPLHADDGSSPPKERLEETFVTTSVAGSLGILKSAQEKGKTVKRVVMTSSTMAIAPPGVLFTDSKEREVMRGPESRVAVPAPPYNSQLQAYCVGKAAALNASEAFMRDNAVSFDLISIIPSWVFGKNELLADIKDIQANSTTAMVYRWLTGHDGLGLVGNAVLCADVARAHVRALDPDIEGNQSFLLNTEVEWEETIPIAKKYFPDAFQSGLLWEGGQQSTAPVNWDSSKTPEVLGIHPAAYDTMVKEEVGQYLELAKREPEKA